MSNLLWKTGDKSLGMILDDFINRGGNNYKIYDFVIPDFQRDFQWTSTQIYNLKNSAKFSE